MANTSTQSEPPIGTSEYPMMRPRWWCLGTGSIPGDVTFGPFQAEASTAPLATTDPNDVQSPGYEAQDRSHSSLSSLSLSSKIDRYFGDFETTYSDESGELAASYPDSECYQASAESGSASESTLYHPIVVNLPPAPVSYVTRTPAAFRPEFAQDPIDTESRSICEPDHICPITIILPAYPTLDQFKEAVAGGSNFVMDEGTGCTDGSSTDSSDIPLTPAQLRVRLAFGLIKAVYDSRESILGLAGPSYYNLWTTPPVAKIPRIRTTRIKRPKDDSEREPKPLLNQPFSFERFSNVLPSVETSIAETPTAEAPPAEISTAEVPTAEAPPAEALTAEALTAEAPAAEGPTVETSTVQRVNRPDSDDFVGPSTSSNRLVNPGHSAQPSASTNTTGGYGQFTPFSTLTSAATSIWADADVLSCGCKDTGEGPQRCRFFCPEHDPTKGHEREIEAALQEKVPPRARGQRVVTPQASSDTDPYAGTYPSYTSPPLFADTEPPIPPPARERHPPVISADEDVYTDNIELHNLSPPPPSTPPGFDEATRGRYIIPWDMGHMHPSPAPQQPTEQQAIPETPSQHLRQARSSMERRVDRPLDLAAVEPPPTFREATRASGPPRYTERARRPEGEESCGMCCGSWKLGKRCCYATGRNVEDTCICFGCEFM